jgi:uncharacterized membrane protein
MNPTPDKDTLKKWSADPNNWKWGIFYYNKEDKRLMPPKKNPAMGFTINFANKKSVLFFLLLILVPITIVSIVLLIMQ